MQLYIAKTKLLIEFISCVCCHIACSSGFDFIMNIKQNLKVNSIFSVFSSLSFAYMSLIKVFL